MTENAVKKFIRNFSFSLIHQPVRPWPQKVADCNELIYKFDMKTTTGVVFFFVDQDIDSLQHLADATIRAQSGVWALFVKKYFLLTPIERYTRAPILTCAVRAFSGNTESTNNFPKKKIYWNTSFNTFWLTFTNWESVFENLQYFGKNIA